MATIVTFDPAVTPQRVLRVIFRGDPAPFRERTDWVLNPDLSLLEGIIPRKYWKHDAGTIVEYTAGEKVARDTAQAAADDLATRERAKDDLEGFVARSLVLRAFSGCLIVSFDSSNTVPPSFTLDTSRSSWETSWRLG